jgi:hypothetical protein
MEQPYYMIDFSASACMFEIRVNDYPIITWDVRGQVATMMPINNAILATGEQTISATILPIFGELSLDSNAELKFNIKLFDVENSFVFQKQFADYKFEPIGDKLLPVLHYTSTFTAKVPYTLTAWKNGRTLNNDDKTRTKLREAYNQIAELITSKKYDLFKKITLNRERNMAVSMYLSDEESADRIDSLIAEFKNGFQMMPISDDAVMHLYANGKVAALKKPNGTSVLVLHSKETEEKLMLDISFYIPEGKTEFEII